MATKNQWKGFVPAQHAHPQSKCAVYECNGVRDDYRRYCTTHCKEYQAEVDKQGGAKVLAWTPIT